MRSVFAFVFTGILSVLSTAIFAASPIYDYQLQNGLKLIVKEDHRSPVVLSSIWYKVGGSYEHSGLTGISHMLEHMMFRGTKQYGPGELDRLISSVGGEQNAMTTNDFTMYYQLLPASQLELSLKLEADRMRNLLLNERDFINEQQVVMEERRMRYEDNPQSLAWERFMAAAFVNNPYHHQTIGWMVDIENLTLNDLRAWYQRWYQPNNAILVIVGDVNAKTVYPLVQKYFATIPKTPVPILKPRTEVVALGVTRVEVTLPAKVPVLIMGYHAPTLVTTQETWQPYAIDVLAYVLGGTNSARLQNNLLRTQRLVTTVQVGYDPFDLHGTLLQIVAIPAAGHALAEIEHAIIKEISALQTAKISPVELASIKAQLIAEKVYSQDSVQRQAEILGGPEVLGLSWQVGETYVEAINRVTPEQVQQVAREFLVEKALTVATLHPEAADAANVNPDNQSTSVPTHDPVLH